MSHSKRIKGCFEECSMHRKRPTCCKTGGNHWSRHTRTHVTLLGLQEKEKWINKEELIQRSNLLTFYWSFYKTVIRLYAGIMEIANVELMTCEPHMVSCLLYAWKNLIGARIWLLMICFCLPCWYVVKRAHAVTKLKELVGLTFSPQWLNCEMQHSWSQRTWNYWNNLPSYISSENGRLPTAKLKLFQICHHF